MVPRWRSSNSSEFRSILSDPILVEGEGRRSRLLEQLSIFEPLADEAAALGTMLELVKSASEPFSRDHFVPGHFTVGAFVVAQDHLLLIHHRRMRLWLEPGGHVDADDPTLEDAARRELFEETAITGQLVTEGVFDIDAHTIPAGKGEPPHIHYNVGYLFTAEMVEPSAALEEIHAARWVPLDRVGGLNTDAAMMRAVAKLQLRRDSARL